MEYSIGDLLFIVACVILFVVFAVDALVGVLMWIDTNVELMPEDVDSGHEEAAGQLP